MKYKIDFQQTTSPAKLFSHAFFLSAFFLSAFSLSAIVATQKAQATVFSVTAGYGYAMGSATSVSTTSTGTRTTSVSFPTMFHAAMDMGNESLRFVLDGCASYSPALAGVDLSTWSVGGRWFPLNVISGKPGESVVAVASQSLILPYILLGGSYSQYNSIIRNRDGLLTKVTATSLGAMGSIGVDVPLDALISNKASYDSFWGATLFAEARVMANELPITSPSLTTTLIAGLAGVRWRF